MSADLHSLPEILMVSNLMYKEDTHNFIIHSPSVTWYQLSSWRSTTPFEMAALNHGTRAKTKYIFAIAIVTLISLPSVWIVSFTLRKGSNYGGN